MFYILVQNLTFPLYDVQGTNTCGHYLKTQQNVHFDIISNQFDPVHVIDYGEVLETMIYK